MSEYRTIAEKIPAHIRKEIVGRNLIRQALGQNEFMKYIFEVWYLYLDPHAHKDWSCGICRNSIKENFLELESVLAEMQKENNLLDAIN